MLTVGELIEQLKKLDKDLIICKNGYEGGYTDDLTGVSEVELYLNVNDKWYYGEHEEDVYLGDKDRYEKGKRVLIG